MSSLSFFFCTVLLTLIFFFLSQKFNKGDLSDFGWTISVVGWGIFSFLKSDVSAYRNQLVVLLITLWGLRLGYLILRYRILRPGEDSRYAGFRESWGDNLNRNFLILFLAQPVIAALLAIPFHFSFLRTELSHWDLLGVLIWLTGFIGVFLADQQLQRYKSRNRGVCEEGLWAYSRHPNYFFEWFLWLSYPFFTISSNFLLVSAVSPVLMLYLLLCVTGVPPSERQALKSKGDEYRAYQKRVSVFIPWSRKVV